MLALVACVHASQFSQSDRPLLLGLCYPGLTPKKLQAEAAKLVGSQALLWLHRVTRKSVSKGNPKPSTTNSQDVRGVPLCLMKEIQLKQARGLLRPGCAAQT